MKTIKFISTAFLMLNVQTLSWADAKTTLMPSIGTIQNLDIVLKKAKEIARISHCDSHNQLTSEQFNHFPETASTPTQVIHAYAGIDRYANGYAINIDWSSNCNGAKYCNIGRLIIQCNTKITFSRDNTNQESTHKITLLKGVEGYYTPGLAKGDFWPANLQWLYNGLYYKLESNYIDNQTIFVSMANAVIKERIDKHTVKF